jgi:hypothetical protein
MLKKLIDNFFKLLIKIDNGFLCDTCRYNHPSSCPRPSRPNEKKCGDYARK